MRFTTQYEEARLAFNKAIELKPMTLFYMCYRVVLRAAGSYRKRSFVIELLKSIRTPGVHPAGSIRYNMGDHQERSLISTPCASSLTMPTLTANGVLSTFP